MRRRDFISLVGGAAAWPLAAQGQQPAMPVVGFLHSGTPGPFAHVLQAFRKGLGETDYVEGRNLVIEQRWAEGQYDRLPALAAELVRRRVSVIAATGGTASGLAAKSMTERIPIVFVLGGDAVQSGLVTSISRPTGNITGVNIVTTALEAKRLGLLRELIPQGATISYLLNPSNPDTLVQLREVEASARAVDPGADVEIGPPHP